MRKIIIVFLTCFQIVITSYTQNLIHNGDFEIPGYDTLSCMTLIYRAKWLHTSELHGALFFATDCVDSTRIAQKSVFGSQKPHKGKVYLGFYNNSHLHTPFIKPLERGKSYCFTMYVSMAEKNAAKGEIGVYFAKVIEKGTEKEITPIAYYKPNFSIILQPTDTANWIRVCGTYKASGGEKYIVIGNFKSVYKNKSETFIYVDNVSVEPVQNVNNNCCPEELHAKTGDTITLKQLLYKTSSAIIENSSFPELERLVDYLKKNQNLKIQINGHTDNTGNIQNNLKLSKDRAKSVYSYLLNNGIKAERMKYDGFGSTKPLSINDTEENKAKNRRVEIAFTN